MLLDHAALAQELGTKNPHILASEHLQRTGVWAMALLPRVSVPGRLGSSWWTRGSLSILG